jgi:hypothetical protein
LIIKHRRKYEKNPDKSTEFKKVDAFGFKDSLKAKSEERKEKREKRNGKRFSIIQNTGYGKLKIVK